jgi:P27 family predicted phage terminase small subunit
MRGRKPDIQPAKDKLTLGDPPAFFSKDAKAEWRRCATVLNTRRTLTITDLGTFENYCIASGEVRDCYRTVQKEGRIMQTDRGPRKHPAVAIMEKAMQTARQYAAELGLTPVSRSRPAMIEDNEDTEDTSALGL